MDQNTAMNGRATLTLSLRDVATTLGSKGQLAPEIADLTLTIKGNTDKIAQAFLLTPTEGQYPATAKLLRPIKMASSPDGLKLNVGKLTAAAAILLVKEGDALLQMGAQP